MVTGALKRLLIWSGVSLLMTSWRLSEPGYGVQGDIPLHFHIARSLIGGASPGEWWPAWAGLLEGGRGSSLFTFYPPLFHLLTGLVGLTGMTLSGSLGAMTVLTLVFNQWAIWRLAASSLAGWPRIWASVLGVVLPGVGLIGINRGLLPQALAGCFLPLVIDGASRILDGERSRASQLSLIAGLVGVVLSHTISAYLAVAALALLVMGWGGWRRPQWWQPLVRLVLGCGLSAGLTAFFWLPMLSEMSWVKMDLHLEKQGYRDYLLFARAPVSTPYREAWQGLNEVAGIVTIVQSGLALIAALLIWRSRRLKGDEGGDQLVRFGILGTLFGLAISLPALAVLWEVVPGLPYIQFPWRWQPLIGMVGAILVVQAFVVRPRSGSAGLRLVGETVMIVGLGLGVLLTSLLCRPYGGDKSARHIGLLTEMETPPRVLTYAESRALQESGSLEFLRYTSNLVYFRPRSAETTIYSAVDHPGGLEIVDSARRKSEEVVTLHLGMEERRFRVRLSGEARARLLSYAYPRWQARLDGRPIPVATEPGTGLMLIDLPEGEHEVRFSYQRPWYPRLISLVTLGGALIGLAAGGRRRGA
ncbi:MAG: hypothetical protein EBZ36_03800 [Acidobacteria bacterium]|nr:hypothetical protein [Acidobacteriota bacterium]